MSAYADTSLLALQTRATSLTGRDCYSLDGEACRAAIAAIDAADAVLLTRTLESAWDRVMVRGRA